MHDPPAKRNELLDGNINAVSHGIFSKAEILPQEDPRMYEAHCQALYDDQKPNGYLQCLVVKQLAMDYWRLRRLQYWEISNLAVPEVPGSKKLFDLYLERHHRAEKLMDDEFDIESDEWCLGVIYRRYIAGKASDSFDEYGEVASLEEAKAFLEAQSPDERKVIFEQLQKSAVQELVDLQDHETQLIEKRAKAFPTETFLDTFAKYKRSLEISIKDHLRILHGLRNTT